MTLKFLNGPLRLRPKNGQIFGFGRLDRGIGAVILAFFVPFVSAGSGDFSEEFLSGFISDLGPLISLFGEQVARQFMSESLYWYDHIIFALCPLGIITAVVGAIRISGPSSLKALIGRARESRGIAEMELTTSTSTDVCELWNGRQMVRVMGSGKIEQLLFFPELQDEPSCGFYTLEEAEKDGLLRRRPGRSFFDSFLQKWMMAKASRSKHTFDGDAGADVESQGNHPMPEEEGRPKVQKPQLQAEKRSAPNITLNGHSNFSIRWHLRVAASVGVILQSFVIIYMMLITYSRPKLRKDDSELGSAAWAVMFSGTVILVAGLLTCSYIIERASVEEEWSVKIPQPHSLLQLGAIGNARKTEGFYIFWIQKAQTVNDQTFDSFVLFGKGKRTELMTSRPNLAEFRNKAVAEAAASRVNTDATHTELEGVNTNGTNGSPDPGFNRRPGPRPFRAPFPKPSPYPLEKDRFDYDEDDEAVSKFSAALTVFATIFTLVGWICQFIGLRGMHWTAAAVHLGATLAMTAVRAWVRADYKGRQTPFAHKIPTDFELDWLAMRLAMCSSQFASHRDGDDASGGGGGLGIHSNGVVSEAYTAARESTVTEGSSGGMEYLWDKMIVAQEERRHGQKKRLQKEKCTNPYQQARHRRSQHEGFSGKPESEQAMESDFTPDIFWGQSGIGWSIDQLITNDMRAEERKLAALPVKSAISQDVFIAIRKRLGVLTEWGNPRVADVSMELSKAIEIVLNTLDPHGKKSEGDADGTHKTESTETSQSTQFSSIWPLEVTILGIPTKLNLYVRFDKEKKRWLVKKKGTEAILSLWYFSLQHTQRYGKETEQFFVFGPADARSLRDLQWWAADSVCPVLEVTTKKSKVIQTGKVQTTLEIDAKPGKWEASARKYGSKIFEEPELDNRLKQSQFFSQRSALKKKRQKLSQIQDHVDAETSCANEAPGILTGLEADSLQIGEMSRVRSPVRVDISKVEKTAFFGFTGDSHTSAEKLAKTPLEFYQPEVSSIVRFGPKKLSSSSIYEQLGNDPNSMRMKPEPKASEFLCFNLAESASTADNARLLVLPRHTSMLRMCSMHMFWAFLVAAAGRMGLDLVEGALEKTSLQGDPVSTSSILPGGNGVWVVMGRPRLHNALLSDLAKNIAAAGVCNRDEAHQLIVLALSAHKRLPLDPVIRWVQARVRIYLREHRVGEASRMSVWLWQVCSTCGWTTEASVDALAMVVACSVVAKSQDNKSLLRRPLSLASHGTIHDGSLVWLGQGTVLRHVWEAGGMGKDEVAFMESCQEIILAECRADDTGRRACFVRDLSLACTFGRWLDGIGTVGDGWLSTIAQIATKTSTRPVSTGTRHSQGQKIRPTYDRAEKYVTGAYWGWGWFFNISKQAPERVTVFDKELPNASALYKGDFLGRNILHHVAMHISKDDNTSLSLRHRLSRKPPPGWDRLKGPFTVSIALASPDVFGLTPLHLAAAVGNSWAVTFFLDESPNASAIDCFGRTPLHLAAGAQPVNPYIIKLLARAAPTSVTATDVYGELPLHYYISSNSSTQSEGVDKTSGHETADGSCEAGSYEPSSETGKSLDAKGGACHCESEVLGCLIKRTGMPQKDAYIAFKTRDSAASTLVHHAAIAGNITAITELRNIAHRETVVDCSECCRVRGHCKKAQVIVQALSSSNTKPFASEEDHGYGVTPLFVAVNHGQGPFISFLLKTGSDFIISGSLDPNLRFGIYSVQLLLELLDSAIDSGFESVCELLLDDHNDSLRIEDLWDGGYHILCRAISHERPSIVKIVLRFLKDYNVNSRPHQWSPSAMDEAQLRHNAPIIDLLTEHATKIGTVVAEPRKVASDLYEKSPYDRDSIEPDHLSIKTADLAYSSSGELESGVEDEHDPRSLINSDNEMHPDSEEDEHDDGSNNINGMNGINNNSNDNAT